MKARELIEQLETLTSQYGGEHEVLIGSQEHTVYEIVFKCKRYATVGGEYHQELKYVIK